MIHLKMDRSYFWSVLFFALQVRVESAGESSTILPPNFVPMIDGATARPVTLPEILSVRDDQGKTCTLASLDSTVVIWPRGDESREIRIEMPERGVTASTNQKCSGGNGKPLLVVTWSFSFQLCFFISKNDLDWTLDRIVFAFNSSEVPLGSLKSEMKVFESEPSGLSELKAPLGVSYRCWAAKQYSMTSTVSNDNATLILTNFQIQPYLDNDDKVFGEEEILCPEDITNKRRRRHRDSTVTVAVGSSLAVMAVVTVICYAMFRHFKLKAVGYGTMQ